MLKSIADIDTTENLRLHRIGWVAQRFFRVGLLLFIAFAAAGGMGTGPLAKRTERLGEDFIIRAERFARAGDITRLEIENLRVSKEHLSLLIPYSLLDNYEIDKISLEPLSQTGMKDGMMYKFEARPGGKLAITLTPIRPGYTDIRLHLGGKEVEFSQFVYP